MLIQYTRMNALKLFEHNQKNIPSLPARVVVKTDRGLELGNLVGQLSCYKGGQFRLSPEQLRNYFAGSDIEYSAEPAGKFVRYASSDDINEQEHLRKIAGRKVARCRQFIKELNLPMKVVDAEHIFGGERVIFYFMADGRVDFRELVKKLAHEYQTRIEMRQIGARDEAKLLGDVESCGQQCCCRRFLNTLKPVNMRMAKMQKATLDPSKISGYCGRLKCCLRFEDETYTKLKKRLPKRNTIVKTEQGEGKVIDTHILTQLVVVAMADGKKVAVSVEEIESVKPAAKKGEKQQDIMKNETGGEAAEPKQSADNNA